MILRVTRKSHTHAGKSYRAGETFKGSERLLAAFGDRLEAFIEAVEPDPVPDALDALRSDARDLGVNVDNRWGAKRLQEEINNARATASE
jgi:hypothetical protein